MYTGKRFISIKSKKKKMKKPKKRKKTKQTQSYLHGYNIHTKTQLCYFKRSQRKKYFFLKMGLNDTPYHLIAKSFYYSSALLDEAKNLSNIAAA